LIGSGHPTLPAPLVYAEQKKMNGALQNTADIFALCSVYYMLQWTKASGGVARMEKNSVKRASLLYSAIDESCAFEGIAFPKDRSLMNVIFRLRDPKLHNKFLEYCEAGEIVGLNGHRGLNKYHGPHLRASLYNGQTMENVHRLIEVMHSFEKSR
jgi:phosphoserine aminotransferase